MTHADPDHVYTAALAPTTDGGRLTLPIEEDMDDEIRALVARLQPDAVRNSDGTELPEIAAELVEKVYSTYFPARGDQEFALAHPDTLTHMFLMTAPATALGEEPLTIRLIEGYFLDQLRPDTSEAATRYLQVIDRTTGDEVDARGWELTGEGHDAEVRIVSPTPFHVYTVAFLAEQVWDSTQMYNYLTNDWHLDPSRQKVRPYEVRKPVVWDYMKRAIAQWCKEHPEVDVVRFTTFFHHFTLVFNTEGVEKFVDWFGYSASVSPEALEAFEAEYGYGLTGEDFVDAGYYNCPFRVPTRAYRDWIDFQHHFVTAHMKALVDAVHDAGKEAMMFLGDNWMGCEPYGEHFPAVGMDAVVGSVGSAATCRMISDIPGVRYTEGRFLPYFFPDVFNPDGDPLGEANESWRTARRAIVRFPLSRMGYGGYLSLATQFPEFIDRIEEIIAEFRSLHSASGGERPANSRHRVGILNAWGALRTWQTHMVAHAKWYKQIYTYLGVVESLAGLPFDVEFLSFDDVRDGVPEDIAVLINAGSAGTAFSGGPAWADEQLVTSVRRFVAAGGGFIGVGEPSAYTPAAREGFDQRGAGAILQLADVLGIDRETGWSLSTNFYPELADHEITADLPGELWAGERPGDVFATTASILRLHEGSVDIAVNSYGAGHAVYLAGLPYSTDNARLLHRAIVFAATGSQDDMTEVWLSGDARLEVAYYPNVNRLFVFNSSHDHVETDVRGPAGERLRVKLGDLQSTWIELAS
ncbi:1,3-beta-galactosyl-N-acetylhexosamine phosphorylase [Bowdeniella nasicola]|uniref:1,3-beta-galactosyl-N-acetylhexosamine phosphorylase n=1 Tax=Bowdeniella nasicola TaxID=208480 RepID=A0A1Q5Q4F7_9ACTO|nr:1,3-beta-galactosyl-N-acetylhexosamine phosphorylase [Bowdeniella nasicola]OKL54671.1 1,3-beta-galactosyl-N-acetylhexosamine phosphorylase [Bowdeniella nasicola]